MTKLCPGLFFTHRWDRPGSIDFLPGLGGHSGDRDTFLQRNIEFDHFDKCNFDTHQPSIKNEKKKTSIFFSWQSMSTQSCWEYPFSTFIFIPEWEEDVEDFQKFHFDQKKKSGGERKENTEKYLTFHISPSAYALCESSEKQLSLEESFEVFVMAFPSFIPEEFWKHVKQQSPSIWILLWAQGVGGHSGAAHRTCP